MIKNNHTDYIIQYFFIKVKSLKTVKKFLKCKDFSVDIFLKASAQNRRRKTRVFQNHEISTAGSYKMYAIKIYAL